jgi:hypothetical protein
MRRAVIKHGQVINIILASEDFSLPDCELVTLEETSSVGIGWTYDGVNFTKPEVDPEAEPDFPPGEPQPSLEELIADLRQELTAVKAELDELKSHLGLGESTQEG